jgi:ABC-type amino acid transport system permease subunit
MWQNFGQQLYDNVIKDDRYLLYLDGLKNTLLLTFGAAALGIVLGTLVAIFKVYEKNSRNAVVYGAERWSSRVKAILRTVVNLICDTYLTVIRGTPAMVQIMVFGYIIFAWLGMNNMLYVATLALGINSGAYVAEIVRAGIQAVDVGQSEAGRSLGLTSGMTMRLIILPQAIKNILPALANEGIVLFKETAIVGYIAVSDLTYNSTLIRSRTYSPVPLLIITAIYLSIVIIMTFAMRRLERSLAKSDRNN